MWSYTHSKFQPNNSLSSSPTLFQFLHILPRHPALQQAQSTSFPQAKAKPMSSIAASASALLGSSSNQDTLVNLTLVTSFIYLVRLYHFIFTQLYQYLSNKPLSEAAGVLNLLELQFSSFQISDNIQIGLQLFIKVYTGNLRYIEKAMGVSYYDRNQPRSNTNVVGASTVKTSMPTSTVRGNSNKENFSNKKPSQDIIVIVSNSISVYIRDIILS